MNDTHGFQPDRLRQVRLALDPGGLEKIAVACGVTARTVTNWEKGAGKPDADALECLRRLARKPFEFFFTPTRAAS